ncbi:MAG: hypothetical protein ABR915_25660 [Thermoguttaceae bacterium]
MRDGIGSALVQRQVQFDLLDGGVGLDLHGAAQPAALYLQSVFLDPAGCAGVADDRRRQLPDLPALDSEHQHDIPGARDRLLEGAVVELPFGGRTWPGR